VTDRGRAFSVLTLSTLAFTICFAVWMMNGVLITFLAENGAYDWSRSEMGWLIGIPVLTGAVFRLPAGVLADRFGGRPVFAVTMLLTAAAAFLYSYANTFWSFVAGGLGFGLAGSTFAVGIAYCSVWFPKRQQGTALGIFGAGNAGAAITAMGAPTLLNYLTATELEGWRMMPRIYAAVLVVMTAIFWFGTFPKKAAESTPRSLVERLQPLKNIRVWRFGLYYFLAFGGFVALAQWLIPYYVNVYTVSVGTAGLLSSIFTLPSGLVRALGGWWADKMGARTVMYWVLGGCLAASILLIVPRMDIHSPGEGVMALGSGTVTAVTASSITVDETTYPLDAMPESGPTREGTLIWPTSEFGQNAVVQVGDVVEKKQLLAKGVTHIFFQANIWVFTGLAFIVGILMGIGKAAVYKHIPEYFPKDVGTVGGIVGVLGGLGGFFCPIFFGTMLDATGIWTTTWMFFACVSLVCLVWMHWTIRKMTLKHAPDIAHLIESPAHDIPLLVTCPTHGIQAHLRVLPGGELRGCSLLGGGDEPVSCEGHCVTTDFKEKP
jgi:MFS transporter, NNP family, nitrate/nitrite transporter